MAEPLKSVDDGCMSEDAANLDPNQDDDVTSADDATAKKLGTARIVVAILSIILVVLGVSILLNLIDMPTVVGVLFAASGVAGITLEALPIILKMGLPNEEEADPSKPGLNR